MGKLHPTEGFLYKFLVPSFAAELIKTTESDRRNGSEEECKIDKTRNNMSCPISTRI